MVPLLLGRGRLFNKPNVFCLHGPFNGHMPYALNIAVFGNPVEPRHTEDEKDWNTILYSTSMNTVVTLRGAVH